MYTEEIQNIIYDLREKYYLLTQGEEFNIELPFNNGWNIEEVQRLYNSINDCYERNIILSFKDGCLLDIDVDHDKKSNQIVINEYNFNNAEEDWNKNVASQYKLQVENHRKKFQKRIDEFNIECEKLANELGKDLATFLKEDIIVD